MEKGFRIDFRKSLAVCDSRVVDQDVWRTKLFDSLIEDFANIVFDRHIAFCDENLIGKFLGCISRFLFRSAVIEHNLCACLSKRANACLTDAAAASGYQNNRFFKTHRLEYIEL